MRILQYSRIAIYLSCLSCGICDEIFAELDKGLSNYPGQEDFLAEQNTSKAWFSLVHKHKHKLGHTNAQNGILHSILDTSSPQPDMINKMVHKASAILLLKCSHEVWAKEAYEWSTALCLCLCLCQTSFHQSKLQCKHMHKKNEQCTCVLVLMLILMR